MRNIKNDRDPFTTPLISIIVPVYNCEKYLKRCLDSLVTQSLQNIEVIMVNNGSTDNSEAILRWYAERDKRFRLITQQNQGPRGSRNTGLLNAQGEYLAFVDADDYVDPDYCRLLWEKIDSTHSDIAICDYGMVYGSSENRSVLNLAETVVSTAGIDEEIFYLRYFANDPVVWNKLYRRTLLDAIGIRFEIQLGEDVLFHLRLVPHIKRLCTIGRTLYHYVQRKGSVMHSDVHLNENTVEMLKLYLNHGNVKPSSAMVFYVFAVNFTGFLFSGCCIGKGFQYFREQIAIFRKTSFFSDFCRMISRTEQLAPLYEEEVVSKRFYHIQKMLFSLCACHHDILAAAFMWLIAHLIILKNHRRFLATYN